MECNTKGKEKSGEAKRQTPKVWRYWRPHPQAERSKKLQGRENREASKEPRTTPRNASRSEEKDTAKPSGKRRSEEELAAPSPGRAQRKAAGVEVLAAPSTGRRPSAQRRKSTGEANHLCQGEVLSGPIPRPKRGLVRPWPNGERTTHQNGKSVSIRAAHQSATREMACW